VAPAGGSIRHAAGILLVGNQLEATWVDEVAMNRAAASPAGATTWAGTPPSHAMSKLLAAASPAIHFGPGRGDGR